MHLNNQFQVMKRDRRVSNSILDNFVDIQLNVNKMIYIV